MQCTCMRATRVPAHRDGSQWAFSLTLNPCSCNARVCTYSRPVQCTSVAHCHPSRHAMVLAANVSPFRSRHARRPRSNVELGSWTHRAANGASLSAVPCRRRNNARAVAYRLCMCIASFVRQNERITVILDGVCQSPTRFRCTLALVEGQLDPASTPALSQRNTPHPIPGEGLASCDCVHMYLDRKDCRHDGMSSWRTA